jgi:hypothetical protein
MGRPKASRSAQKTLKMTPRADFAVQVFAPLSGQSGNAYISAAIEERIAAHAKKFGIDFARLWHPDATIRELRLFLLSDEYPFTEEQLERRAFIIAHMPFFYERDGDGAAVNERRARELYPRLDEWRTVEGDHWEAGRRMAAHLKQRGLTAPEWPPEENER